MQFNYEESILFEFIQTYGISKSSALKMCKFIRVSPLKPSIYIMEDKKQKAFKFISTQQQITFKLKDMHLSQFVYLYQIRHFKSFRHRFFYPVNGQRTCTNGNSAKRVIRKLRPLIYKRLKTEQRNKRRLKSKIFKKKSKKKKKIKNLYKKN